jgi:MFS family permease
MSTFRSLRIRNFRLWFLGQGVSVVGTYMQIVAQSWLVLRLTHSGSGVAFVTVAQFVPLLVLGIPVGVIVDQVDRLRMFVWSQAAAGVLAAGLGILTIAHAATFPVVMLFAFGLGLVTVLDQPLRGVLVMDIVGPDDLSNAIGLNNAMFNLGRVSGPAVGGLVIAAVGIGPCFLFNAASYAVAIVGLKLMRRREMNVVPQIRNRARGAVKEGLVYVREHTIARSLLLVAALTMAFTWQFDVLLPLVAERTFSGDAATLGLLASAVGVGALVGSLRAARAAIPLPTWFGSKYPVLAICLLATSIAPTLPLFAIASALAAAAVMSVFSRASALLQASIIEQMRGRVLSIWMICSVGTRPLGALLLGWVADTTTPRVALASGACAALVLAAPVLASLRGEDS